MFRVKSLYIRQTIFVTALLFFSLSARAVTVVWDLDWTTIYQISEDEAKREPENVVRYGEYIYRFSDYAAECMQLLHSKNVNIVFYSGGPKDRNEFIVGELYKRAFKTEVKKPLILSGKADLADFAPNLEGFSQRYKKDLLKAVSAEELKETVLVDDDKGFALPGQESHLLNVPAFRDVLEYPPSLPSQKYDPPDKIIYNLERHKMLIATEAILQSIKINNDGFLQRLRKRIGLSSDLPFSIIGENSANLIESAKRRMKKLGIPFVERQTMICRDFIKGP